MLSSALRALALTLPLLFPVAAVAPSPLTPATPSPYDHGASFTPDFILRVTTATLTSSTCTPRPATVVNGTSPGPELRIASNTTTWIRVYNDMESQNLTMHWHGLTASTSPFSDGTPLASQWPIPPTHFFDYELHPLPGSEGTYFYHSHVGFQAVTCAGALIVTEPPGVAPPYVYDDERTLLLSDVFNKTDEAIEAGLTATPFAWSGETLDVLVNGKGRANTTTTTGCNSPLEVIKVKPGTTYRLRVIGATALSFVQVGVEGHADTFEADKGGLEIIEADGAYTQRLKTGFLQVGSGERYSLLLTTKGEEEVRRRVRDLGAKGPDGTELKEGEKGRDGRDYYVQIETRDRPNVTVSYAIVRYVLDGDEDEKEKQKSAGCDANPPPKPVLQLQPTVRGWLDYKLEPLRTDDGFPTAKQVTRRVTIKLQQMTNGTIIWANNGLPWTDRYPKKPYLVSLYESDGASLPDYERAVANGGMDPVTRAFPAKIGEVIEIVLQNTGSAVTNPGGVDIHPFHAHGEHYWNIGSGNGTYDPDRNEERLKGTHPAKRDTTMLYRYSEKMPSGESAGWRAWRLRVGQAGVWMVHCHILQHMIMGMQTVWVTGDAQDILQVPKPMVDGYLTFGGSVMGNATHDPKGVEFYGP